MLFEIKNAGFFSRGVNTFSAQAHGKEAVPSSSDATSRKKIFRTVDEREGREGEERQLGPIYMVSGTRDNPPLELPWTT